MVNYDKLANGYGIAFVVMFVGFNTYFGWNRYPESTAETITDVIAIVTLLFHARYRITADVIASVNDREVTNGKV